MRESGIKKTNGTATSNGQSSTSLFSDLFNEADLTHVPVERAFTIPANWYTDPIFEELDRRSVFETCWQYAGHLSELQAPGDVLRLKVGSKPILVVRDSDASIKAFHDVCRHRGGPLRATRSGTCVLQCAYHGWTYQLDGSLRGMPRFDRTELFDKKDFGLVPVEVSVWESMVFVRTKPGGVDLADLMSGIRERIAPIDIKGFSHHKTIVYEVASNWKVYVDNFLEGYHVPFVHPELCKMYDFRNYTTELARWYSLQTAPLSEEENIYSSGGGRAFYYFVYPNFMMNILPGRLQTNLVVPDGPDRCKVVFGYFYDRPPGAERDRLAREDLDYSDHIQDEDREVCEQVHERLKAGVYQRGRFSPEAEEGVHHFQGLLKDSYRVVSEALSTG